MDMRIRTQNEIVERMRSVIAESPFFDFRPEVLVMALDYEHYCEFGEMTREQFEAEPILRTVADVYQETRRYMEFAWGKVRDHRGLSADRSIQKITELAWLLCRDDVVAAIEQAEYAQYGAPKLKVACEMLDLPVPEDERVQRMAQGLPCRPDGCDEGCGR